MHGHDGFLIYYSLENSVQELLLKAVASQPSNTPGPPETAPSLDLSFLFSSVMDWIVTLPQTYMLKS